MPQLLSMPAWFLPCARQRAATWRSWRRAAVEALAREAAPNRVNGVAGAEGEAVDQTCAYLAAAPGVTGQLLQTDGISQDNP